MPYEHTFQRSGIIFNRPRLRAPTRPAHGLLLASVNLKDIERSHSLEIAAHARRRRRRITRRPSSTFTAATISHKISDRERRVSGQHRRERRNSRWPKPCRRLHALGFGLDLAEAVALIARRLLVDKKPDVATAVEALHSAARKMGTRLTANAVAIDRAEAQARKLDEAMEKMRTSGTLQVFNEAIAEDGSTRSPVALASSRTASR